MIACIVAAVLAPTLDGFDGELKWKAIAADGVAVKLSQDQGRKGKALRIDFDFQGRAGWASAELDLGFDFPENYEFSYWLRGEAPVNNLEFKLIHPDGETVFWHNRQAFEFPREWTRMVSRKRHISYAWGPNGGVLKRMGRVSFTIAANTGGKGTVWIDDFAFRELPPAQPPSGPPTATASTEQKGHEAPQALEGAGWRSATSEPTTYTLDFGSSREFGGLTLRWAPGMRAADYKVETSDDGAEWSAVRTVTGGAGERDDLFMPDAEARYVRLELANPPGPRFGINRVVVRPSEFGASLGAFWQTIAKEAQPGAYPRHLLGEFGYFTVVGAAGSRDEGLLSEEGAFELRKEGPTLEPFVRLGGQTLTWAQAKREQSLRDGWRPAPTVVRHYPGLRLAIEATPGTGENKHLRYTLTNTGAVPQKGELYLALRPFQVNPTWMFLNTVAGVAKVRRLTFEGGALVVPGCAQIVPSAAPTKFGAAPLDEGEIGSWLARGEVPGARQVEDPNQAASAAMAYEFGLAPGKSVAFDVMVAPEGARPTAEQAAADRKAGLDAWDDLLGEIKIEAPHKLQEWLNVWKSQIAYILVNKDGPGIQPGSRCYERSWMRDGALTSTALLRAGRFAEAKAFIEWYATYLPDSGFVPCVVDRRGADMYVEHDSHGQWIFLLADYLRFTGDLETARKYYPTVRRTVAFLEKLRQERMTDAYKGTKFWGLVPESASHEGYMSKPMHSYWDGFFVLRGFKDAAYLAHRLGDAQDEERANRLLGEYRRAMAASIAMSQAEHKVDYIPGCAELGDFDATSTAIGLFPCGELATLARKSVDATFDKYWTFFADRRSGKAEWDAYTPYELRIVSAYLELRQPERARALIEYFMGHRRPLGWNQWAEVVWRDPLAPKYVGDMPHTWVGSEFVKGFRNLFLMERPDGSLLAGPGLDSTWIGEGETLRLLRLPTYGGRVDLEWRRRKGVLEFRWQGAGVLRWAAPEGDIEAKPGKWVVGETG